MVFPPHLPAPVCNIKSHNNWMQIRIILLAVGFGLLAGLTGAAIMVGWVWNDWGGGAELVGAQHFVNLVNKQLDAKVRTDLDERLAVVYSHVNATAGVNYFNRKDKVGDALVVSSDGWLAMRASEWQSPANWRVYFSNGATYPVEKSVFDRFAQILYIKLKLPTTTSGQQFKVVTFADDANAGDDVYVYNNGNWFYASLTGAATQSATAAHLDSAPVNMFLLNGDFPVGSLAVNFQGRVVGISLGSRQLFPAQYVARMLPTILETGKISYPSLGVEGWYDTEQPLLSGAENINGFYVTKNLGGSLRAGDIVTSIGNTVVTPDNLWYNIFAAKNVEATVLRKGKSIKLNLTVLKF